jgi:RHH-type proline utilization regulon transcriptional repressor/proline dehydrogenase/delta 1-pyrroline-5-carboxylate dehydrogenase
MSKLCGREFEASVRRIGEEIFQRAEAAAPPATSIEFWQRRAMDWLTTDEDLKQRLFHFISVLPSLSNRTEVARQLQSDLAGKKVLPPPLQLALGYSRPNSMMAHTIAGMVQMGCLQMARQFICGATPDQAITSVERLRRDGMAFTLDVLGETVHCDDEALAHQKLYVQLFDRLSEVAPRWKDSAVLDAAPFGPVRRVNISIKLTSIVASMDADDGEPGMEIVLERLRPILLAAKSRGAFVNIDMEHFAIKDMTLEIFRRILMEPEFRNWPDCGIVIQAYLKDARRGMSDLIAWARRRGTPITVRLVKGAYWDSETAQARNRGVEPPVFEEKWQSDVSFETVARMMLENADIIRPAFGSHSVRSIAFALATERVLQLPPRTLEIQMLTGMGNPLKRALVEMKQRVRIYSPFGDLMTGMAYLIRRLIENTANESFLRQTFDPSLDKKALLTCPGVPDDLDSPAQMARILPASPNAVGARNHQARSVVVT